MNRAPLGAPPTSAATEIMFAYYLLYPLTLGTLSIIKSLNGQPHSSKFRVVNVRLLKEEVSRKFDVISKPKNVCLTTETKK